jgi:hypothetical protein
MESVPGTPNEGTPFPEEPFVFPSFGNIGPPYISTLSLPGFTIGLLVWFFSTLVIPNAPSASYAIPPPEEHQPHVDPFPSSPVGSSSLSSSSPGGSINASNQEDKKKKKRNIKKKKNKKGGNPPATVNHVGSVDDIDKPTKTTRKPKFPCRLCKGDHLLKDFPGLPNILEVWSMGSKQPISPMPPVMLVTTHQLVIVRLEVRKVESNFLVGYVKDVIKLTFSLVWMRLHVCWKRLLISKNNLM